MVTELPGSTSSGGVTGPELDEDGRVAWQRPPPGSRPPPAVAVRVWPRVVVVAAALVVAAVVVWGVVLRGDGAAGDPTGGTGIGDDPAGVVGDGLPDADEDAPGGGTVEEPAPDPVAEAEAELEALRASDRYVAFAEHERARQVEWPGGMVGAWSGFARAGYANVEELWDEVVGPIRDDALLAGEPFGGALWNEQNAVPAYLPGGWSDETTGRGDAFVFTYRFIDPGSGEPVERTHAVLIRKDGDGDGGVAARMEPFELRRRDAINFSEAADLVDEVVWGWVQEQTATGSRER